MAPPTTTSPAWPSQTSEPLAPQLFPPRSPSSTAPNRNPLRTPRRDHSNPMTMSSEKKREQRRDGFLNKVQTQREGKLWDSRGEQILQSDYVKQRRAWEEEQARAARLLDPERDLSIIDEPETPNPLRRVTANISPSQPHTRGDGQPNTSRMSWHNERQEPPVNGEDEIEALLAAEQRELEALIEMHDAWNDTRYRQKEGRGGGQIEKGQPSSLVHGTVKGDFDELRRSIADVDDPMDIG